ncbi:hypothetical protein WJX84_006252 [Apatococcus fuscideae]|uniref:Uncharacterized protein n=1 Tax=Apatococcus fuscideae TaxID=2026836 RepID=A0AAW1T3T7_9CHLO
MTPWIQAATQRCTDIFDAVKEIHPQAIVRLAVVGYRDYGNEPRLQVHDFVEKEGFTTLQTFLGNIKAESNFIGPGSADEPEDVAGRHKAELESIHPGCSPLL